MALHEHKTESDPRVVSDVVFEKVYRLLHRFEDIDVLSKETGIERAALRSIWGQKIARKVKTNFHRLKARSGRLSKEWKDGKTFMQLAAEHDFSPVMMASIILQGPVFRYSKPMFQKTIRNPSGVRDARLRAELEACIAADFVYSPAGAQKSNDHGNRIEGELERWLVSHELPYTTEKDRRPAVNEAMTQASREAVREVKALHPELHAESKEEQSAEMAALSGEITARAKAVLAEKKAVVKTPDFLFPHPVVINGHTVNWLESKATFGDREETRRNMTRQLMPYVDLFGPGLVIYWYGHTQTVATHPSVFYATKTLVDAHTA